MEQIDPMGTSVGRWGVGRQSNLLGQSTRQTIPGKNMSFVLKPGLFAKRGAAAGLYGRAHALSFHFPYESGAIFPAAVREN